MGFESFPQPVSVDPPKNSEEVAEDRRAYEGRRNEHFAAQDNAKRPLVDKLLGRNKVTGVDIAHEYASEEEKQREEEGH
jgi:hypothetical protein